MKATSRALDLLLRATGDPQRELDGIAAGDPEHARAEAIRAGIGVLAKVPEMLPQITRATRMLATPGLPARLRFHFEAAELWVAGDALQAARHYARIVEHWPHDLLAMRLAQSCYFFLGQVEQTCTMLDEGLKAWNRTAHSYGFVLAMAAFSHAEAGHGERSERLGREALARDPACPMGVHAVAHAIAESRSAGRGAAWMRSQRAHWSVPSRMRTHNAWHLAMFDLEDGRPAPALNLLDHCLLPAAKHSPTDACDATSLLSGLAAQQLEVGDRWQLLSQAFERNWRPGFWPYVDMHAAVAHMRAGAIERSRNFTRGIEHCAAQDDHRGQRARRVTLPFLRALALQDTRGPHVPKLASSDLAPLLHAAGGSRLQLDALAPPRGAVVPLRQRSPATVN